MIGIAGMIGAGIFALTGIASGIAGPAILVAFLLNGVIATFTGLAYAELGSAIPQAGGGYVWIKESMGDYAGFLAGWIDWAAHTIACSLYAVTFGAFFSEVVIAFLGLDLPQFLVAKASAIFVVSFLAYVNYMGAKESGKLGGAVTLLKVSILVLFAVFGIVRTFSFPNWQESYQPFFPNGWAGMLAAMGLTFIAFEGFEIIVQSGEEVKNPERNIPRAIVMSLWTAVAIYVIVAFSLLGAVKSEVPSWQYLGTLGEFSLIRVANQIMPFGAIMIIAGGLISTVSAMNATIFSSSRVVFALSRSGFLNKTLSRINNKTKTPHFAIFFSYLIIAIASLAPIEAIASVADIMFIILFLLVNITLMLLRLRRPDLKRTFKVPFVPFLPVVAIVFQIVISYYLLTEIEHGTLVFFLTIGWIVFGSLIYYTYSEREMEKRVEEKIKTVYKEIPLEEKPFVILVPVANPVIAKKLVKFAEILARQRNGEIIILNTVRLPMQTPSTILVKDIDTAKEMVSELVRETKNVPVGGVVKVGHFVSEAILNAVDEFNPDLVLMGWRGRTFRRDAVLGSTIDPVLLKAKCDVLVLRFEPGKEFNGFESILIPTAGGPHAILACEIARDIAKSENSRVKLLYVGRKGDERKVEKAISECKKVFEVEERGLEVESEFIVSGDAVSMISKEAENFDLILLGASEKPFLQNFLMGVFPEKIVRRTLKTVGMTRKWVKLL
jgi:amino acid transporter